MRVKIREFMNPYLGKFRRKKAGLGGVTPRVSVLYQIIVGVVMFTGTLIYLIPLQQLGCFSLQKSTFVF